MNRSALFFGLSSVVALAGLVGACSSTTTTVAGDTPEGGTSSEAGTGKETGSGKDSSTPVDTDSSVTPTGDEACAAETTRQACGTCCLTNHPTGAKVISDTVIACGCKGTGSDAGTAACGTECAATACAATPATPDMACNTCLQASVGQGGACQQAASDACTASADCVAEQKCITPCQTKN
jgi:hypothetical protein